MNLDTFEKHGSLLIKQGRVDDLDHFLSKTEEFRQYPSWLSMYATLLGMQGKLEQALLLFEEVLNKVKGHLAARTLLRSAVVLKGLGYYKKSLSTVEQAERIASHEDIPLCLAEALRLKGYLLFSLGDLAGGIDSKKRAITLYEILGESECVSLLSNGLGLIYSRTNFFMAHKYYLAAQNYWQSINSNYNLVIVYNNLAVLYMMRGDYENAATYFDQALQISHGHHLEAYLWCGLGELFLELEIYEEAQILFSRAQACGSSDYYLLFCLSLLRARLFAALGLFEKSLNLLQAARPASVLDEAALYLAWGEVELRRGGNPSSYFERAMNTNDQLISSSASFFLSLLKDESPRDFLTSFEHRYVLIAQLFKQQALSPFWRSRVQDFSERLVIWRRLLRNFDFVSIEPQLSIYMLAQFSIKYKGKRVYFPSSDARNLFSFLLILGQPTKKALICEALWPFLSQKKQHTRFKKAIKILRDFLFYDVIKYDSEIYYFNFNIDYQLDVDKWKTLVLHKDYESAFSLYDDFLPNLDAEWANNERQNLYLQWVEIGITLVNSWLDQEEYNKAWEVLKKLLTREKNNERVYCLTMQYWGMRGDYARVVLCFSDLERVLADLGLKPSPKAVKALHLYSKQQVLDNSPAKEPNTTKK